MIMIKNGRPYTNENGSVDDSLVTSHTDNEMNIIKQWIDDNILSSTEILYSMNSYSLKHLLQHDTGIYLTNNEFKDAMLFAGYQPINPNDLNWKYCIVLKKTQNNNPSGFFIWAKKYIKENSPQGDFVRDMIQDFDFPIQEDYKIIEKYLERVVSCDSAKTAFRKLWREYIKQKLMNNYDKMNEKGRNCLVQYSDYLADKPENLKSTVDLDKREA